MNVDERIEQLEATIGTPGTIIQRVLHETGGIGWAVALGESMKPKKYYYGATIHDALLDAEKDLL